MKFSIVTITHNRAHLIAETIESVLNQTYQDFEHIIIDDGSTDNTEEIVKSFQEKRINYHKYTKHTNRSYLRNEGIRKAKGDIICILDSDDIWHKEKLVNLFEIFNSKKEVVFIIHNVIKTNESLLYNYKTDFYRNILKDILKNKILPYPFYSFRKSLLKNTKIYDENMVDGQQDFFLRIASQYPIYFISKVLSFKKTHYNNISKTPRVSALVNYNITLKKLLNNHKLTKKKHVKYRIENFYKIAKFYFDKGEKELGFKYLNKILKETHFINKIHLKSLILKFSNGAV